GYDGLFVIKPDGRMYVQSGIGNLGTESMSDCQRVAAEMVGMPWEKVELTWGHTGKNLPWSCVYGGRPEQYTVANERVSGPGGSLTLAQAAQKAIEYGGAFDGHELPENINAF